MTDEPIRKSQRYVWQGGVAVVLGWLMTAAEWPIGFLLLGVGLLLLLAGLIGEATRR